MDTILEEKLAQLNHDELMVKAIREVFDSIVNESLPGIDEAEANVQLGEKYRAFIMAAQMIEDSFVEIDGYREDSVKNNNFNKGK